MGELSFDRSVMTVNDQLRRTALLRERTDQFLTLVDGNILGIEGTYRAAMSLKVPAAVCVFMHNMINCTNHYITHHCRAEARRLRWCKIWQANDGAFKVDSDRTEY